MSASIGGVTHATKVHDPAKEPRTKAAAPCRAFTLTAPDSQAARAPEPARPAGPLSPSPGKAEAAGAASAPPVALGPAAEAARTVVKRILTDESKVDKGLHDAMTKKGLSSQELLVLQAQVIQYSQEIDVASRVVDRATGAIKQVLQTQV